MSKYIPPWFWTYLHYNPWKVLMIHVEHVISVVENENFCKPMVDHFHWNEFEWNTFPFKHMRVKCVISWGSTYLVCSIFNWKCLTFLNYLKMLFMIYYKFWRAWFFFPDGILMLVFYFILFYFLGKWMCVLPETCKN